MSRNQFNTLPMSTEESENKAIAGDMWNKLGDSKFAQLGLGADGVYREPDDFEEEEHGNDPTAQTIRKKHQAEAFVEQTHYLREPGFTNLQEEYVKQGQVQYSINPLEV